MQISTMSNIGYTERLASLYNATEPATTAQDRIARAESVTISALGRAMNDAISRVH